MPDIPVGQNVVTTREFDLETLCRQADKDMNAPVVTVEFSGGRKFYHRKGEPIYTVD